MALDFSLIDELFEGVGSVINEMIKLGNAGEQASFKGESARLSHSDHSKSRDKTASLLAQGRANGWKLIFSTGTFLFFDTGYCPLCFYCDGTPYNWNRFRKRLDSGLVKGGHCTNPAINKAARQIYENYPNYKPKR